MFASDAPVERCGYSTLVMVNLYSPPGYTHSLRASAESRTFCDRKRAEGKRHTQALIALARRRINVLWAMLRDGTTFEARSAA